jgi:hypothetical protein
MRAVTTYVNRTPKSSCKVVLGYTLTATSLWCCALDVVWLLRTSPFLLTSSTGLTRIPELQLLTNVTSLVSCVLCSPVLQECVENLFLSLGAALGLRENQQRFLDSEGFELMLRCLKEQQYAAGTCCPVL